LAEHVTATGPGSDSTWCTPASTEEPIHSAAIAFGYECPTSDLFGTTGRARLAELELAELQARLEPRRAGSRGHWL
jgi:hypothetical protein